jgi:hypothetical protein
LAFWGWRNSPPFFMSSPPLILGPIPPYNNPPIEPQFFKPSQFFITILITGENTTVTTSIPHNYIIGQLCRLLIPNGYGCTALDEQTGYVITIPSPTQVILNINSQNINDFISASLVQKPQIVAIGDISTGAINANGINSTLTYIPGSFLNISPY